MMVYLLVQVMPASVSNVYQIIQVFIDPHKAMKAKENYYRRNNNIQLLSWKVTE